MMARSRRSNQRPDTVMQDRINQVDETSCTARPDHTVGSIASLWPRTVRFRYSPVSGHFQRPSACLKSAMNGHGGLFDRLIGARQEGGWDRQTDFPSGRQIDDQFEPSRLLDGQLGRFASFENFRNKVGRYRHHLRIVGTVGDETARVDTFAERMQDW